MLTKRIARHYAHACFLQHSQRQIGTVHMTRQIGERKEGTARLVAGQMGVWSISSTIRSRRSR